MKSELNHCYFRTNCFINRYVKEEFKRHKNASEAHAVLFMKEWTNYYVTLSNQMGRDAKKRPIGKKLDDQLENFTDDQLVQLHELYKELKDFDDVPSNNK